MSRGQISEKCFEGFFFLENGKKFKKINNINWITGKTFHILKILLVYNLDNCVLYLPILNIWQHSVETQWIEISCLKYWWSVYLVFLRNKPLKFCCGHQKPKLALWTKGGGGRGRGRWYIEKTYINVSLNTRIQTGHRNVNQAGASKMVEETVFRTMMQNSIH